MNTKIKVLYFIILIFITNNAFANSYGIKVPKDILKYEWCYYSNQCEVPEKIQKIIFINFLLNRKGLEPLY